MKKIFLLLLTFQSVIGITQAQTLDISCTQTNIGCAPYRTVFYNNSLGVDKIEIICEQQPSEIQDYKDSIVIIYNEGFTWDQPFNIEFYAFTSAGRLIDSKAFPIQVFFNTTSPILESETVKVGERFFIQDPTVYYQNDFIVDFGDGTVTTNFTYASHIYTTPGSYTINASWRSQCGPSNASFQLTVQDTEVSPPPQVLLSIEDTVCPNVSVQCTVKTNFATQSINLDYGTGLTDQFSHTFTKPGIYPVKAIVSDLQGKITTLTDTIVVLGRTNSRRLTKVTPLYARIGETISFEALGNFESVEWLIRFPKSKMVGNSNIATEGISDADYKKGYVILKDLDYFQKEFYKYGLYTVTFTHNTCGVRQREITPVAIFPQRIKSLDEFSDSEEDFNELLQTNEKATIYPNPVVNKCNLKLPKWTDQNVSITIINTLGQTVAKHNFNEVFVSEISFDVNNLKSGNYFLKMESNSQNQVVQFFKQ